jgi:hypothetical protein
VIVSSALEAPAVIAGFDDVAVVGQAIEQRGGQDSTGRVACALPIGRSPPADRQVRLGALAAGARLRG